MVGLREGPGIVLTLISIALLLGVGLYVLAQFRDSASLTTKESVGNTTQVSSTAGDHFVGHDAIDNSTFRVYNQTGTYTLQPGVHYQLIPDSGHVIFTVAGAAHLTATGALANLSYSYSERSEAYKAVNQTITGVNEFPSWMTIIVVVVAAAMIIGIMLQAFGGAGPV